MDKVHFLIGRKAICRFFVVGESAVGKNTDCKWVRLFISSEDTPTTLPMAAWSSSAAIIWHQISSDRRRWVYLDQSVSLLSHRMVVRSDSGISRVADLG
jgi:hypothetical protein